MLPDVTSSTRVAVVAVVTALVLGGCSGDAPEATAPTPSGSASISSGAGTAAPDRTTTTATGPRSALTDEQVREVLQEMDTALGEGDLTAYLQHVDPALAPAQRAWFEALQAVPMDVRQLRLDSVVSRNSGEGTVAHVGLRHQITGGDPVPLLEQYRWVFAQEADGPVRLVSSTGRNGELFGHPQVWDTGEPVAVLEGRNVLLLAAEDARADAELLLDTLDLAAGRTMEALPWSAEGREQLVVNLVDADLLGTVNGMDGIAVGEQLLKVSPEEIPWDAPRLTGSDTPVASRLLLDLEMALADLEEFGPSPGGHTSLRHVAASSALWGPDADLWPQGWVVEGFPHWWAAVEDPDYLEGLHFLVAEHHAWVGEPDEVPVAPDDTDVETYDAFVSDSMSLALHVADAHGDAALVELAGRLAVLDQRHDGVEIEQVYDAVLGVDQDELLAGWATWTVELAEGLQEAVPPPSG